MPRGPMILFLVATFLVGATAGVVLEATVFAPEPPPPPAPKELTAEEIAALCAEKAPDEVAKLEEAQKQVQSLQAELATKEAELAAAEAEAKTSEAAATKAAARIKALQADVASLKQKVAGVVEERDRLLVELKTTVENLAAQVAETETQRAEAGRWRSNAAEASWTGFVADAKVRICDRGTAKRHDKCEAAVDAALGDELRMRFLACVDSGQATPTIGQLDAKSSLPEFAVGIGDEKTFGTKGWYVLLCDPTLPEAAGQGRTAEEGEAPGSFGEAAE